MPKTTPNTASYDATTLEVAQRELEAGEVVAICDHISLFLRGKLKNEV
jgi:hypothetical protein